MKRFSTAAFLLISMSLLAQQAVNPRDAYRAAYRAWREAEPNLERDAATVGEALAPRATKSATDAAAFDAARAAFLRQWADDQNQNVLWIQNLAPMTLPDIAPAVDFQALIRAETANVDTTITTFSGDSDKGIQQLKLALEKEKATLSALGSSISDRQRAHDLAALASDSIGSARARALNEYQGAVDSATQSAAIVDKETSAWQAYYTALSERARAAAPVVAPSVSGVIPARPNPALTSSATPAPPEQAALAPRSTSIAPVPLARYTGDWVYPTVDAKFFGAQPESVNLTVREQNSVLSGTFDARFKLPAGSKGDPLVHFDFSGDVQANRRQTLVVMLDGEKKGTIELIPGPAFNLLEVNFQTDPGPGKVRTADLLLIKK